jgi:RNA polymerase primary sigma factor
VYLREIGRTPLLTPDQEAALAQRLAQGDAGATAAMEQANLRLVVSIARRYVHYGLPFGTCIAEGHLGLLHAVETYDWQRAYRCSTLAKSPEGIAALLGRDSPVMGAAVVQALGRCR